MTISRACELLNVSEHTLRYYEKQKLIHKVTRKGGKRDYSDEDIRWLKFILRLKKTKMPLKEIKKYSELRYEGNSTISERKEMLLKHKTNLLEELSTLKSHLDFLENKIQIYEEMESEQREI